MENSKGNIFQNPYLVTALALFSCFLWGSAFPTIKVGYELFAISGSNTYGKILFAGYRFFLAAFLILTFCLLTGREIKIRKGQIKGLLLLGLLQTAINYTFFYIGVSNISGTKGSILSATGTLFSVLLAHFFYKEDKLTKKKIIGLIVGFSGVVLVNINGGDVGGGFSLTGEGFVLMASLTGAISGIYTKALARHINTFLITAYQLLIGSLFLISVGFLGGAQSLTFTGQNIWLLLYLSFLSAAAFSIWTILLKHNGVGKVSIYKFTVPIFGTFLSYIILKERLLGTNTILAIILVSLSIILINIDRVKKSST
ncbi:MAG TPA: DMT family transporter [Clostridia bacterium]|nr:DMT family transporter [Clostridia bacterium]